MALFKKDKTQKLILYDQIDTFNFDEVQGFLSKLKSRKSNCGCCECNCSNIYFPRLYSYNIYNDDSIEVYQYGIGGIMGPDYLFVLHKFKKVVSRLNNHDFKYDTIKPFGEIKCDKQYLLKINEPDYNELKYIFKCNNIDLIIYLCSDKKHSYWFAQSWESSSEDDDEEKEV